MPVPNIDATPGSPDANSYGTVAGLLDYSDSRPNSPTLPTPSVAMNPYLLYGTQMLDTGVPKGYKTFSEGALLWPRGRVKNNDPSSIYYYDSQTIPQPLEFGLYEMCLDMINRDIAAASDLAGFSSVKIGSLTFEADSNTEIGLFSPQVKVYINHLFVALTGEPQNSAMVVRV